MICLHATSSWCYLLERAGKLFASCMREGRAASAVRHAHVTSNYQQLQPTCLPWGRSRSRSAKRSCSTSTRGGCCVGWASALGAAAQVRPARAHKSRAAGRSWHRAEGCRSRITGRPCAEHGRRGACRGGGDTRPAPPGRPDRRRRRLSIDRRPSSSQRSRSSSSPLSPA